MTVESEEKERRRVERLLVMGRERSQRPLPAPRLAANGSGTRYAHRRHLFTDTSFLIPHQHDNILLNMASTSTLTSVVAIAAAFLTAFLLSYLSFSPLSVPQSSVPEPVNQPSPSADSWEPTSPKPPAVQSSKKNTNDLPGVTFLQQMKNYDLSEIVPLYPGSGPLLVSEVDSFNNVKIAPRLQSIVTMDYFRFVKLNLSKKCSLWPDNDRCAERYVCGRQE